LKTKAGGFTLLEMLVATAMVAVLAASLYASLRIAFKARTSAVSATQTVRRTSLAMDLLQADLQSAVAPKGILAGPFVGQENTQSLIGAGAPILSFYATFTPPESDDPRGDVCKIEYVCQLDTQAKGFLLQRQVTRNLLAPQTPEPEIETVCRGLALMEVRYFDGTAWQDAWDSTTLNNVLPLAVEVSLRWEATDAGALADGAEAPVASRVILLPCGQDPSSATPAASPGVSP
jgi:type II secretion system protein J